MRNKLLALLCIIAVSLPIGTAFTVSASVSAEEIMQTINVNVKSAPQIVYDGDIISVTISLSDVLDYVIGSSQWYINGVAVEGYYDSMYDLFIGKTSTFHYKPTFSKGMQSTLSICFDIAYGGILKRTEILIPLETYPDDYYDQKLILSVKPVRIDATIKYDTPTYETKYLSTVSGNFTKGEKVYYCDRYSYTDDKDNTTFVAAQIMKYDGSLTWVPFGSVDISRQNYTVFTDHSSEIKEFFVNHMKYESTTPYLVWINLERQKVNVFLGSKGNWKLINTFSCATGANRTPTPVGEYTYSARTHAWITPTYVVRPVLYINVERGIALHSRLYSPKGSWLIDSTMGTPVSHGCIRMMDEGIDWLDYYLVKNSKVVVY